MVWMIGYMEVVCVVRRLGWVEYSVEVVFGGVASTDVVDAASSVI